MTASGEAQWQLRTRRAAHLESGARDQCIRGTKARAAEGTQGAANRAPLSDISLSEASCNFSNGETLVKVILVAEENIYSYFHERDSCPRSPRQVGDAARAAAFSVLAPGVGSL